MKRIFCIGDCCTEGLDHIHKNINYTIFLKEMVKDSHEVINMGRSMLKVQSIIEFPNLFIPENSNVGDIACVWVGTNDIYLGTSGKRTFLYFSTYCSMLKEKGISIIPFTIMPRIMMDTKLGLSKEKFNIQREIFNDYVRRKYDTIIDAGHDEELGLERIKEKYYYNSPRENIFEKDHLNEDGHKYIASLVYAKIFET